MKLFPNRIYIYAACARTMDTAASGSSLTLQPGWKKPKTQAEREAELQTTRAKAAAGRVEASKTLTAVVRRWGDAGWVWHSPMQLQLWQVQVDHVGLGPMAFSHSLIDTASRALWHHPNPKIKDFKDLFREARVKILNGAPPTKGQCDEDPDKVGVEDWRPVLYVAGDGPMEGLTVIKLVLEEKVRRGLLPAMPSLTLLWVLAPGERSPEIKIPDAWGVGEATVPHHEPRPWSTVRSAFSVVPPLGRRHLLAHLQPAAKSSTSGAKSYDLLFFGCIYYFRDGFDQLKVPCRKMYMPSLASEEYVRILYGIADGEGFKTYIKKILEEVLGSTPLLLNNGIEEKGDSFAQWLVEQPSVFLKRTSYDLDDEPRPTREAAGQHQPSAQSVETT